MVTILKKVNKINKLKFSKNLNVLNENFLVEAQVTIVPCHSEDSIINNIPYRLDVQGDDFVRVNGEHVFYSIEEIDEILNSKELKNLLLKEIVKKSLF